MNLHKLVLVTIFFLLSATAMLAQDSSKSLKAPDFDADLAKKLGADEYGMRNYIFVILKTGPMDAAFNGKKREDIFADHLSNIERLTNEGKLAVAGPFGKNDKGFRGMFIFNVSTVDEARKLVETDPAVKAGILIADLTPWYGSASLMATPEIHKKIAKANP